MTFYSLYPLYLMNNWAIAKYYTQNLQSISTAINHLSTLDVSAQIHIASNLSRDSAITYSTSLPELPKNIFLKDILYHKLYFDIIS